MVLGDSLAQTVYRRVLLKLSGEALAGEKKTGIDPEIIAHIAGEIKEVHERGIEVALVIGAGNIFRGSLGDSLGIDRVTADNMGMLATVMNSLAVGDMLNKLKVPVKVMSAIMMNEIAEQYVIGKADSYLSGGEIIIIAGGTGHPYFTTDTAAGLRAIELSADVMLKATRVDGLYTGDPEKDSGAKKITSITYMDVIRRNLRVMDITAVSLCMENRMPVIIFNMFEKGYLIKIVHGEDIGTKIS